MTSQAGYTQLNSGTATFQISSPTLIEGRIMNVTHVQHHDFLQLKHFIFILISIITCRHLFVPLIIHHLMIKCIILQEILKNYLIFQRKH